jgi:hypothetical protein
MKCTKLEIAVSSLTTARKLFADGDYISSNILAGAGQQILRDLCLSRGIETTIATLSSSTGHPVNDIHNLVVNSYNKMKHADKDPNDDIEVSEDAPRALIVLAATDLMRLNAPPSKDIVEFIEFAKSIKTS